VDSTLSPNCIGLSDPPVCNVTDFYKDFGNHDPVYAPYTNVVYSNIGISILGMVIEAVSGMAYEEFVQQQILEPLGLNGTSVTSQAVSDSDGFIPLDDIYWGTDIGFEDP
jgi:hypothetical protein